MNGFCNDWSVFPHLSLVHLNVANRVGFEFGDSVCNSRISIIYSPLKC